MHQWDRATGLLGFALVCAAALPLSVSLAAPTFEMRWEGPWIFTERPAEGVPHLEQMAATAAAEDGDVWLLLVCRAPEVTASLMNGTGFPFTASSLQKLLLRTDNFPIVAVEARAVQPAQLSIDAAMTRHLLPLVIESERLIVSINDAAGTTRDYTFSLQPNRVALGGIMRNCASHAE